MFSAGVSAGHYTAYAKNPQTDSWHYYNDDVISRQKPQEQDFSNAYILFYSRQGTRTKGAIDRNWLKKDIENKWFSEQILTKEN